MATKNPVYWAAWQGNLNLGQEMQHYPFIFSTERKWRFRRHFFFWLFWWLFQSLLYSFVAFNLQIKYLQRLPVSSVESLFFLLPHMFLAYSLMYFAIPKLLLKGKYFVTALTVGLLFLATAFLSAMVGMFVLPGVHDVLFGFDQLGKRPSNQFIFPALLAGLRGAITIGGMAAAIKLMKYWYMKEQRNLQLQKQNFETQLQLLKAQVHPHFLFNTLNNIYSYTQNTSSVASRLVMGLSEMLRYMLYECNQPLVPLHKELKMLRDYITLEEIRYNEQLDINISLPEHTEEFYIAPLLLIPFVENAFKHGTSQMIEQPWISLHISVQDDQLEMKLVNGKAENYIRKGVSGIGIANARKRLDLLYPNKHSLKINHETDVFVVSLKLRMERIKKEKLERKAQTVMA